MKIIDQTPYKEIGELSWFDRAKAVIQFGPGWIKEIEAQEAVILVLDKFLDKKYTLMRNITPSGLGTAIPFILIGPTGVYVMTVTHLTGTLSARGDQWRSISGETFRIEKPNLLTRTDKMARVVQVFLQRQGYTPTQFTVEPILICSNPTTHVDTVRPIIRVIMRDSLERFATSIAQAQAVLSSESVFDIENRILNPPVTPPDTILEAAEPGMENVDAADEISGSNTTLFSGSMNPANSTFPSINSEGEASSPNYAKPEFDPAPAFLTYDPDNSTGFQDDTIQSDSNYQIEQAQETEPQEDQPVRRRLRITRKQGIFLIVLFVVWIFIMAIFAFLIIRDFIP